MKKKSAEWIQASLGTTDKNERAYIENFHPGFTRIAGSRKGYSVYSLKDFEPGEIVEEVPVLTLHTTLNELIESGDDADPVMGNYFIPHPIYNEHFNKEGIPMIVGLGNFLAYKKSDTPNVSYNFDPTFNIITVRATKQIPADSELFLPQLLHNNDQPETEPAKKEKKMGCGCGKKKQQKQELQKQAEEAKQQEVKENTKFKSMVDGKDLKSIKVD